MPIRRKVFRIEAGLGAAARGHAATGVSSAPFTGTPPTEGLRQLKDETDSIFHAIKET